MIKNLWNNIHLYCGCHNELVPMHFHDGAANREAGVDTLSAFYACPKYDPENRKYGEKPCMNRMTVEDMEKAVEVLSSVLEDAQAKGDLVNLEGFAWRSNKDIEYRVVKHNRTGIHMTAVNYRVLK